METPFAARTIASNVANGRGGETSSQRRASSIRPSPQRPTAMKPDRSILDASFRYVPSVSTSVSDTWRRFGWQPASVTGRQAAAALASPPSSDRVATPPARGSS
jgi:hypothetical protein